MKSQVISKVFVCLALFGAVGAFDCLTGYEVSSYPMYLMPILLTFFYFGKVGGYLACLISAGMWLVFDILDGHHFSYEVLRYYAALSRAGIYAMFVYGLSVYVKTVAVHRRRLEEIRSLIPMCHGCGKILWKDGTWKTAEDALISVNLEAPECPACVESEKLRKIFETAPP